MPRVMSSIDFAVKDLLFAKFSLTSQAAKAHIPRLLCHDDNASIYLGSYILA